MSYTRSKIKSRLWWREQDSNLRRRSSADLQSAAFDRSAIPPTNTLQEIRDLASSVNWELEKISSSYQFYRQQLPHTQLFARADGQVKGDLPFRKEPIVVRKLY